MEDFEHPTPSCYDSYILLFPYSTHFRLNFFVCFDIVNFWSKIMNAIVGYYMQLIRKKCWVRFYAVVPL